MARYGSIQATANRRAQRAYSGQQVNARQEKSKLSLRLGQEVAGGGMAAAAKQPASKGPRQRPTNYKGATPAQMQMAIRQGGNGPRKTVSNAGTAKSTAARRQEEARYIAQRRKKMGW